MCAWVAELVDARDLKSLGVNLCTSSILVPGTIYVKGSATVMLDPFLISGCLDFLRKQCRKTDGPPGILGTRYKLCGYCVPLSKHVPGNTVTVNNFKYYVPGI